MKLDDKGRCCGQIPGDLLENGSVDQAKRKGRKNG